MPLLIRGATEADLPDVRSCLAETWHATYDPIFGAEQVTTISNRWHAMEALRANLTTPQSVFLVACDQGEIVGTASARQIDAGHLNLGRLYVVPRAQGVGCGKALLAAAITSFADVRRMTLDVEPRNTRAIAFYEAQGFRQIAIEKREHAGQIENAAVFEKIIAHL